MTGVIKLQSDSTKRNNTSSMLKTLCNDCQYRKGIECTAGFCCPYDISYYQNKQMLYNRKEKINIWHNTNGKANQYFICKGERVLFGFPIGLVES